MRLWLRGVGSACVVAGFLGAGAGQPVDAQAPVFRAGVDLVTVDLTVLSSDGAPRADLQVGDLLLSVDGKPRPIESLRLVRVDRATPPAGADAPADQSPGPSEGRRFVLVVDRDHIPAGEGQQMLAAGARFIRALPAADRAAVRAVPGSGPLRFSLDRDVVERQLRLAVGTYRPPMVGGIAGRGEFMIGRDEAIQVEDGRPGVLSAIVARECPPPGGRPSNCPDDVANAAKIVAVDARQRAAVTLTSVRGVIQALGSVEGATHLVLITGGPVHTSEDLGLLNAIGDVAAQARVTVHALQVAEAPYQARTDRMQAQPAAIDQTRSAAYMLAGITGGLAITSPSGDVSFNRLSRELSAGYELAFHALPEDRDGRLHRIEVTVRRREFGLLVRARRSFTIDPAPADTAAAPGPAIPAADDRANDAGPEAPAPVPAPVAADPDTPVTIDALKAALGRYVDRFEREFSAVVAEERYVQMVHPWRGNPKGPDAEPGLVWQDADRPAGGGPIISRRQLLSDVLMVQSGDGRWVGYRDVAAVDGRPVRDRSDRVGNLFLSRAPDRGAQLGRIAAESARYNLGDVLRTINIPTLTLSFLRSAHHGRYRFAARGDERVGGRRAHVLAFTENVRPTLIGTPRGGDVPIEGRVWLDADTGTVSRTEVRLDRGSQRRTLIRVDYQPLASLAVWVPDRMWEWYEGGDQVGRIAGDKSLVQCLAVYSNFRRFSVSTSEDVR